VERGAVALRAGHLELATELADQALAAPGRAPAASVTPGAPGSVPSHDTLAARSRMQGAASRLGGLVALRRGDLATARDLLARSVAAVAVDDDPGAGIAARNALALVEAADGDREAAVVLLEEALAECRRTGETHLEAAVENNLADQLHALGRGDEAMVHLKRAVALFAEVGGTPGELEPEIWKLVSW
jgi:tetratricopeptide (TPR) repeat protein